ncbi:hypothetical protein CHS0354_013981 [Potamilus streckersoni]|uniref:C2H2-type domain-containing protein n=2 Tax=Potamilus streckersoni TaxID=2493646 RepID=A0AAE0TL16_9BIVA|nr:hypothetical protein CHS0354_013981 [Potamilus streckersoni]
MKDISVEDAESKEASKGSDAVSPQAADVVEKVIDDGSTPKEKATHKKEQSKFDENQESGSTLNLKRENHTPESGNCLTLPRDSEQIELDRKGENQLGFATSTPSKSLEDLRQSYTFGNFPIDETSPRPFPYNGANLKFCNFKPYEDSINLRFSLEKAREEFRQKYSHLGSPYEENLLRQKFSLPSARENLTSKFTHEDSINSDSISAPPSPSKEDSGNYSVKSPYSSESDSFQIPKPREGLYFCHLCSYAGRTQNEFEIHMTCHFEHVCPHCDYKSRTEGRLKRHIKDFHSEDTDVGSRTMPGRPKIFRCKQCDFSATNKVDFWSHSRSHIKEDKVLQCPKCPFVTEYKHHLEYHLRNHFGSKPFRCPKCNYACVNKSMLNSHMKSHTNVYQYRCADCTYATKYCHSLKLHLRKYNHKPATVLNADGSLPQGIDAAASGLSLLSKRGPPRGPRGPRKDKMDSLTGHFLSMPPSPVRGMVPGMMSPYWSLLNQMPNGLPGTSSPSLGPLSMNPVFAASGGHLSMIRNNSQETEGSLSIPFKCNFCSFVGNSREVLTSHVMKVHAAENQDLFTIFGISSEALLEENRKRFYDPQIMKTPSKSLKTPHGMKDEPISAPLQVKTEVEDERNKTSPQSWPDSIQEKALSHAKPKSMSEVTFQPKNGNVSPRKGDEIDILKQMTLKFGSGPAAKTGNTQKEIPLDLTKPKSTSPPIGINKLMPLQENQDDAELSSNGDNSLHSFEQVSPSPRKRSRKGKAYKLDTLCLKLQEKQNNSLPSSDEEESGLEYEHFPEESKKEINHENEEDFEKPHTDEEGIDTENDHVSGSSEGDHSDVGKEDKNIKIECEKIHSDLKILNRESHRRNDKSSPSKGDKYPEEQNILLEPVQDCRTDASDLPYHNRRKPVHPAVQKGNEIAWRILNNPFNAASSSSGLNGYSTTKEHGKKGNGHSTEDQAYLSYSKYLSERTASIPTNNGTYECSHCQMAFKDCIMYTMHMGYHGYKDPYKCNMCGTPCKDKVDFFLHIARAAHN